LGHEATSSKVVGPWAADGRDSFGVNSYSLALYSSCLNDYLLLPSSLSAPDLTLFNSLSARKLNTTDNLLWQFKMALTIAQINLVGDQNTKNVDVFMLN
jgi:hypothetical protein